MTTPTPEPTLWLVQTKLIPPHLRDDIIPRPRLLAAVSQALNTHPLTLISAPPGYGKTTLLAGLPASGLDMPVAWLSLDEDDNDPIRFFNALVAALQRLWPTCGLQSLSLLSGSSRLSPAAMIRRVAGSLINDLLTLSLPFVLVIDDLHLITEPAIYQTLDYLLEHLPPTLRLAIATRYAPPLALSRLRARGQLAEFRLDDLRFTDQEVSAWLNERLALGLADDNLRLLQQRTEGWVAGVRLLALSLGQAGSEGARAALIARLSHSQRHVFDFLADEVLRHQEDHLRRFLLETSILSQLTPFLCLRVTGREDAPLLLEEVYRRNLFITLVETALATPAEPPLNLAPADELADAGLTYRYHALFANFLRRQLAQEMPDQVKLLHRRAAEAHFVPGETIRHYLAAQLWAEAAQTIETLGRQQLEYGYLGSLRRWIEAVPEPARQARPWLNLLLGADDVNQGHYESARPWLEAARRGFETGDDKAGHAEALVQLGEVFVCLADVIQARPILEESLTYDLPLSRRIKSQINLVWTSYYQQDWAQLEQSLAVTLQDVLVSADKGAYQSVVLSLGPQYVFGASGATPIKQFCLRVLERFGPGVGPAQAGALAYLGYIYALEGKLDQARQAAVQAQAMVQELGSFAHLELYIDHVFLFEALIRADEAAFTAYFENIRPRLEQVLTYRQWLACYTYLAGRAYWLHHRLDALRQLQVRLAATTITHELPEARIARPLLESLVARSEGRYAEAEISLRRAIEAQTWMRHPLLMTHARLDLAHLYLDWSRPNEALAELRPALAELEEWEMPGVLLQEGRPVIPLLQLALKHHLAPTLVRPALALLGPETNTPPLLVPEPVPLPAGESLSPRELEVLHLVAAGLTNQEIADQLVIAPGTAKRHTINIYGKLGVNNRTQAVAKARELKLL